MYVRFRDAKNIFRPHTETHSHKHTHRNIIDIGIPVYIMM